MSLWYVAAPLTLKESAAHLATVLRDAGHQVTSRWHDEVGDLVAKEEDLLTVDKIRIATANFNDLHRADSCVVLLAGERRGHVTELGYAIRHCGVVHVVETPGTRAHVMAYASSVHVWPSATAFLDEVVGP